MDLLMKTAKKEIASFDYNGSGQALHVKTVAIKAFG